MNKENANLILDFYGFMKENGSSERHQNNNLKAVIAFSNFIGLTALTDINNKEEILSFLQTKIKNKEEDPDQRWITTYNDYLYRIKHFFRWLRNGGEGITMDLWKTPPFMVNMKPKKTKRLSPYSETEIWDKDEFLSIIKCEPYKRNKAALTLMWDLNARNHEITLLKLKNIRTKEKYGEGEIPFESKTGSGPLLLTVSFPYVRDWLNEHPFKNEPNAKLICNLHNRASIKPEALQTMMNQLKSRILRLVETGEIKDEIEKEKLLYIVTNKRFNPYCMTFVNHLRFRLPSRICFEQEGSMVNELKARI
jgi:integrase/recombinase XerD